MKRIFILFIFCLSLGYAQTDSIVNDTIREQARWPTCINEKEGDEAFACFNEQIGKFLSLNVKYPQQALINNVQGTVYVEFIIEKDGSVSNPKALRDPGFGLGDEAVRVVNLLPTFIPGKENGIPVRVLFRLPVKFTLNDGKEKDKKKKGKR